MPLQKSNGVAIFLSLQKCGVFLHITVNNEPNPRKPQAKIRLAFFEPNEAQINKTNYKALHVKIRQSAKN